MRGAGCDEKVVRRKVKTGHIQTLEDGTIDADYLSVDWRSGETLPADNLYDDADNATLRDQARALVDADGAELWQKAEAERVKENYAARLKQLEYERESSRVVEIDDVVVAVASEYAIVRNRLLGIGAKVAPALTAMQLAEEIKSFIDAEVFEALNELSINAGMLTCEAAS